MPPSWDYFCLDQIRYHGHWLTIFYDKTGERYGKGEGLRVFVDGKEIAVSEAIQRVTGKLAASAYGSVIWHAVSATSIPL